MSKKKQRVNLMTIPKRTSDGRFGELEVALQFQRKGRFALASSLLKKVVLKQPDNFLANINLGLCLLQLGKFRDSVKVLHPLHEKYPQDISLIDHCAKAYYLDHQFDLAVRFWELLARRQPDNFEVVANLALAAAASGNDLAALAYAFRGIELQPAKPQAHNNLGAALLQLGREAEALYCFETALKLNPNDTDALSNCGVILSNQRRHREALLLYEKSVHMGLTGSVKHADLTAKMAYSFLSLGQLGKGWDAYDAGIGLRGAQARNPLRVFDAPIWRGQSIDGEVLLVWREQGIGDEIMFYSILPELEKIKIKVIVECDPRLVALLSRSFPDFQIRSQEFHPLTRKSPFTDFDHHIPVGSLARLFRRNISDFDVAAPFGFLTPNPALCEKFKDRMSELRGLKVGFAWRGGLLSATRSPHYTAIDDWFPALCSPEVNLVNIFYGDAEEELLRIEDLYSLRVERWSDVNLRDDQESLAAIISNLDIVISCASAPGSLAGALGVPVIFFSFHDWPNLGTTRWPWYPQARHFSPTSKEMSSVIPSVLEALPISLAT